MQKRAARPAGGKETFILPSKKRIHAGQGPLGGAVHVASGNIQFGSAKE